MFDLLIRGGEIIDGTRAARYRADLAVKGDRIEAIGDLADAQARQTIDAVGKIVAPGFVDVHNHSDGWMLKKPHMPAKTLQGFTTEVLMADGISYAPVNEHTVRHWMFYLRSLNALRMDEYQGWSSLAEYMQCIHGHNVQNAMMHIPYANIRSMICGWGRHAVDDFQMRSIKAEVRRGMEEGAVGMSTGLDYIVQCFSNTEELVEVCKEVGNADGLYVTHVRYKSGLLKALKEAVEIGRRSGSKVHISHLKAPSGEALDEVLGYIDNTARKEVDITFDVYPYQPGSTMLTYLMPYDVWEKGPLASMSRLHDPVIREKFAHGLNAFRLDMDHVRIAWLPGKENSHHQGKTVRQYVDEMGLPMEEALYNLLIEERMAVLMVLDEGDDRLIHPFLQHDLYMMGTDGIDAEGGVVHPRMFGSAGRLLGPCVRDLKLFSLEDAIYKLSGHAASRFGIVDRGELLQGKYADVVVFDAAEVTDRATYDQPRQTTVGIEHVVVNGTPIVQASTPIDDLAEPLPGRFLKYGRDE